MKPFDKNKKVTVTFQNALLTAGSIIFVLICLEVSLNVFAYRQQREHQKKQEEFRRESEFAFFEYDRYLGWKNKPLAEGQFTSTDSRTSVKINARGLRDKEYSYDKPPGVFRILVLGDSFVWGYGVEQKEIFTEKLEAMLGAGVEIINAGVSGYGTDQELLFLEREGLKYKPDLVLVALASNDFMWDNLSGRHGLYAKPYFASDNGQAKLMNYPLPEMKSVEWEALLKNWKSEEKPVKKKGLKGFLKTRTKTYPFLSNAIKNIKYALLRRLSLHPFTKGLFEKWRLKFSDEEEADLGVTKEIFLRMKTETGAAGAQLAVFVVPYKSALEKLPNPFIAEFMEFFDARGIPNFYPYEIFAQRFHRGDKLYLKHDDHWTPAGHELAAAQLYDFLRKHFPALSKPAASSSLSTVWK